MAVAILDSDNQTVNILSELVAEMGLSPAPFSSKDQFLEHINPKQHEIAIISEYFLDVLEGTKQVYPEIDCVAIGWQAGSDQCARLGASHLLKKPFKASEILRTTEHSTRRTGSHPLWLGASSARPWRRDFRGST